MVKEAFMPWEIDFEYGLSEEIIASFLLRILNSPSADSFSMKGSTSVSYPL